MRMFNIKISAKTSFEMKSEYIKNGNKHDKQVAAEEKPLVAVVVLEWKKFSNSLTFIPFNAVM